MHYLIDAECLNKQKWELPWRALPSFEAEANDETASEMAGVKPNAAFSLNIIIFQNFADLGRRFPAKNFALKPGRTRKEVKARLRVKVKWERLKNRSRPINSAQNFNCFGLKTQVRNKRASGKGLCTFGRNFAH